MWGFVWASIVQGGDEGAGRVLGKEGQRASAASANEPFGAPIDVAAGGGAAACNNETSMETEAGSSRQARPIFTSHRPAVMSQRLDPSAVASHPLLVISHWAPVTWRSLPGPTLWPERPLRARSVGRTCEVWGTMDRR